MRWLLHLTTGSPCAEALMNSNISTFVLCSDGEWQVKHWKCTALALSAAFHVVQDSEQAVEWAAVNLYKPGEYHSCLLDSCASESLEIVLRTGLCKSAPR